MLLHLTAHARLFGSLVYLRNYKLWDTSVTPLLEMDNQGAIQLSSTTAFLEKTKHIKIKFHHVRALHLSGALEVRYIQTDLNTAAV